MKKSFTQKILLFAVAGLMAVNAWGQAPTTVPAAPDLNDCQVFAIGATDGFINQTVYSNNWNGASSDFTQTIDGKKVVYTTSGSSLDIQYSPTINVYGYEKLHFDIWVETAQTIDVELCIDAGTHSDHKVAAELTAGEWTSVDVNISALFDDTNKTPTFFFITGLGAKTYYLANIYLYKTTPDESCYETLNVAQSKPCEAGYEDGNANEAASKANDGNTGTLWVTYQWKNPSVEWWYVDLLHNYDINRIEAVWGGNYSENYIIQTRQEAPSASDKADDTQWVTVASVTDAAANSTKVSNVSAKGRYVRIHSLGKGSQDCIRLAELRVFATGYAPEDTHDPEITTAEVANDSENITSVKLHLVATDEEDGAITTFRLNKGDGNWLAIETEEGYFTVSDLARGHYSYQVKAVDKACRMSEISTINFDIFNPADNLAIGKTAVAGFEDGNANEVAGKVTDNRLDTKWIAYGVGAVDREWIYVDLEDYYQVSSIDLFWEPGRYMSQFDIQVAQQLPATVDDDTQWYPVSTESHTYTNAELGNTEDKAKSYSVNKPARYIRLRSKAHVDCASIYEFRVYGTGFAAADTHAPVISTASVSYNNDGKAYMTLIASDTEDGAITLFRVTNTTTGVTQMLTTNGSNQLVFDDLDLETSYNFEIQAMDKAANLSAVSELNVYIPTPTTTNIAPRGTATAGYVHQENEAPQKAIDENSTTSWTTYECPDAANRWWQVELDGVYHLSKIAVLWNDDWFAHKYTVKTRVATTDEWTVQPQVSIDASGLKEMSVDLNAKYVRIEIDEQNSGGFIRMHEVQICGELHTLTLNETNNSAIIAAYNNETLDVALERSMPADGYWYTLCLPFDMSADEVTAVFGSSTIAEMTGAEDRGTLIHLNFNYVNAIEAGHPYLFKPGNDFAAGTIIEGVTINNVTPIVAGDALMHFQGIYDATTLTGDNIRFVGDDDYLYSPRDGGTPIGAFRCYFTIPDGSPAAVPGRKAKLFFGDENPTGMDQMVNGKCENAKILRHGVLYIIRDGRTYNAQGIQIK